MGLRALFGVCAVSAVAVFFVAAAPAGANPSTTTVTTIITASGETSYTIPQYTVSLQITVVGAMSQQRVANGSSPNAPSGTPGYGAEVEATLSAPFAQSTLYAEVGNSSGAGGGGGSTYAAAGGGESAIQTCSVSAGSCTDTANPLTDPRLIVAGGGGGGGEAAFRSQSGGGPGGNAGANSSLGGPGSGGNGSDSTPGGSGGDAGFQNTASTASVGAGAGCDSFSGGVGAPGQGGGGASPGDNQNGGGGGGGWVGGSGGGTGNLCTGNGAGGAGGAGSSHVTSGATSVSISEATATAPEVAITATIARQPTHLRAWPQIIMFGPGVGIGEHNVAATLTDNNDGHPVSGQTIVFTTHSPVRGTLPVFLCSAVTNSQGIATCPVAEAAEFDVLDTGYTASFGGTNIYIASTGYTQAVVPYG